MILLILELQYIKSFSELDVVEPAYLQIIYEKMEMIIEFKLINPDFILSIFDEDLTVKKLIFKSSEEDEDNEDEKKPVFKQSFVTFLFIILVAAVGLGIALLFLSSSKKFVKYRDILIDLIIAKFIWNGVYKSLTIGYLS